MKKKRFDIVAFALFSVLACWAVGLVLATCNSVSAIYISWRIVRMVFFVPLALYMLFFVGVIIASMMGYDIDQPRRTSRKKGR